MTNAEWMKANLSYDEKLFIFLACQMHEEDMNKFLEWLDKEYDVSEHGDHDHYGKGGR